jgi:hypothetical protein
MTHSNTVDSDTAEPTRLNAKVSVAIRGKFRTAAP